MRGLSRKIVLGVKELTPLLVFLFGCGLFFLSLFNPSLPSIPRCLGTIIGFLTLTIAAAVGEGIVKFEVQEVEDEM